MCEFSFANAPIIPSSATCLPSPRRPIPIRRTFVRGEGLVFAVVVRADVITLAEKRLERFLLLRRRGFFATRPDDAVADQVKGRN